jgi:hypothetical protein
MEQEKIGACVRPNAALVSLVATSSIPIECHSIYLSFACTICVKQTAQAPVSKKIVAFG